MSGPDDMTIELSPAEFEILVLATGYAAGAAIKNDQRHLYSAFLELANAVNRHNPRWTPYEAQVATATAMRDLEERNKIDFIQQLERSEAQVARLTRPRIYIGTHYANADVPERCPDCDGRDFISYGVASLICKNCWLTAELDKAEAQNRQLREALEEIRRITSGENDFYEDDSAGIVAIDKIAIAALAATEAKENG